jgi:zinc transporter ZupT
MIAASFWSLLLPALEIGDKINGENKILSLMPVIFGFLLGCFFVYITDILLPETVSYEANNFLTNNIYSYIPTYFSI